MTMGNKRFLHEYFILLLVFNFVFASDYVEIKFLDDLEVREGRAINTKPEHQKVRGTTTRVPRRFRPTFRDEGPERRALNLDEEPRQQKPSPRTTRNPRLSTTTTFTPDPLLKTNETTTPRPKRTRPTTLTPRTKPTKPTRITEITTPTKTSTPPGEPPCVNKTNEMDKMKKELYDKRYMDTFLWDLSFGELCGPERRCNQEKGLICYSELQDGYNQEALCSCNRDDKSRNQWSNNRATCLAGARSSCLVDDECASLKCSNITYICQPHSSTLKASNAPQSSAVSIHQAPIFINTPFSVLIFGVIIASALGIIPETNIMIYHLQHIGR